MRASDIRKLYKDKYQDEKLVKVVSEVPEIQHIAGKHGVRIGGIQVHSSGKRVVAVVRFIPPFSYSSVLTVAHKTRFRLAGSPR